MPKPVKSKSATPSKQIRFFSLVKSCGKPETVTLWTKPENNPPFMKAVRENRVLTVVQNPAGSHTDAGEIGFHQKPSALYFVFPKPLPKTDARVIGIKFDLIEERPAKELPHSAPIAKKETRPRNNAASAAPSVPQKIPVAKPKPVPLKKFAVTILRVASMEEKFTVKALNLHDAEVGALQAVDKKRFKPGKIQDEIKAIAEI